MQSRQAPIAIGGLGGSGTRIVAEIVNAAGCWMGSSLNESHDCLFYTFLFVRPEIMERTLADLEQRFGLFEAAMLGRGSVTADCERKLGLLAQQTVDHGPLARPSWSVAQAGRIIEAISQGSRSSSHAHWGWKEPNTHVLLDWLRQMRPRMKYVHVIRNGLDMAFSANQNQLKLWGKYLFDMNFDSAGPPEALEYWVKANRRVLSIGEKMGENFHLLHFESLISQPTNTIRELLGFLDMDVSDEMLESLASRVIPPESIGRYRQGKMDALDSKHIEYAASLGFETQ